MWRDLRFWLGVLAVAACSESTSPVEPDPDPDPDPGPVDPDPGDGMFDVVLESVATGLTAPLLVTAPAGDGRLFIVQQNGVVQIVKDGALLSEPFLDIRDRANYSGESGLLGLAFHPDYAENGYFYVNYTTGTFLTRIERYRVTSDPDRADDASAALILSLQQPFGNHNGGHLEFDPDGMLLIALGDGGAREDPHGHGQNRNTLFGAILRIDVDGGTPYAIPDDNPFRDMQGARPEIWAWGLRNPWRFAIDEPGGRIYIADVGQDLYEEVNSMPLDAAGVNYGWNVMEGRHCFRQSSCNMQGLTLPVVEYDHSDGCSVTGGVVYRGEAIPGLVGHYVYSDYCSGWIRSFLMTDEGPTLEREWDIQDLPFVTSFGRDAAGELYVTTVRSGGAGEVFRVAPAG